MKSDSKCRCCYVDSMCGRSLREGVVFVGIVSLCISFIVLLLSIICAVLTAHTNDSFNSKPLVAANLIFSLVSSAISCYQILISALLLWHGLRQSYSYFCSLWYISHLSILTIYFILFGARGFVCFTQNLYMMAFITISIGILYQSIFIYFALIVNSYIHLLNQERYV